MSLSSSLGRRRTVAAMTLASLLVTTSMASPVLAQQCRGTKEWYEGACRYPDEIEKLKEARAKEAAAARQRAELERQKAEAARRKAEEERKKAEQAQAPPSEPPPAEPTTEPTTELGVDAPPAAGPSPEPDEAPPPPAPPAPDRVESDGISPLAYAGFAVAGVGLLVGTITGALSMSQAADLKDRCPNDVCAPDDEGDVDTMMALGHTATVSFVVAGLGAGVGLYGLFTSGPDQDPDTTASLRPVLGPAFAGLEGTF